MLIIRKAQMDVLGSEMAKRFTEKAVAHLRDTFPDARQRTDEDLRTLVEHGTARAKGYGLTRTFEVMLFINLVVALGADFDARPEHAHLRRLLENQSLSPSQRLQLIYNRLEGSTAES
jgi:hypothetical protein